MNKLFHYLEDISTSKRWILLLVILSIVVVPTLVNLLFTSDKLRAILDKQLYFVGLGLAVFSLWLVLLYFLKKKDRIRFRHLSLTKADVAKGFILSFAIYIAVNIALVLQVILSGDSLTLASGFSSLSGASKMLGVFVFNILISAFIEELLCRVYLIPQGYLLVQKSVKHKYAALIIAVILTQLVFALVHLPRDLFRFEVGLAAIISTQGQLFMSGVILALVYLRTRNVVFLSVFHAFMNYGLPIVNSADFKLYYMVGAFVVIVFWGKLMKAGSAEKQLSPEYVPGNLT